MLGQFTATVPAGMRYQSPVLASSIIKPKAVILIQLGITLFSGSPLQSLAVFHAVY